MRDPSTHTYPVEQGPAGVPRGCRVLLPVPFRRGARPRDAGDARDRRQGVRLQHQLRVPRRGRRRAGGRSRLSALHRRASDRRRAAGADAAGARAGLRAGSVRDPGLRARARAADVRELPEQPDRRDRAGRLLRSRRRVRARARPAGRARLRLLGADLRRLRGAELPGDAGSDGRRRGGVLALQGLEHDRLALRGDRRECRRRRRVLEAEDERRLGPVRGRPAGRRGGAHRARRTPCARCARSTRAGATS